MIWPMPWCCGLGCIWGWTLSRLSLFAWPAVACAASLGGAVAMAQTVDIAMSGGDEDVRDALRDAALTIALDPADAAAQDYVAAARADYRRLLTALYSEGHFGGSISIRLDGREAATISPLDAPRQISRIVIDVDAGPEYRFGAAQVGPLTSATTLPSAFAPGMPARSRVIRDAVDAAIDGWRDEGHAKAEPADQDIAAVHPDRRVDARVAIDPGPRLSFGALSIEGNEAVRTARVREIAGYREGDVFSPADIEAATRRLQRTGTFSSVAFIESDAIGPGATLPFRLVVDERLPRRFGAGVELSSLDGLSASAFWLHRNLLGGAERFRIEGEVSNIGLDTEGIDYRLATTFTRPATFKPDIDLGISATLSQLDEETYFLRQGEIDFGLTQYVRDDLTYQAGVGLLGALEETDERTRDYLLATLPLEATLDQRDDALDATAGYFIDLDITPFYGIRGLGSGGQAQADARVYRTFGRVTLAARGQIGSVFGTDLTAAPADFLFYSGGGGTVRGQPYQSLFLTVTEDFGNGPVEFETGGASFLGGQLEARVDVTDKIGAVGFYDFGFIGTEPIISTDDLFHAGAGVGVRYETPLGPIRLDVATPANGNNAFGAVEFYVGIGQAF